jgi:hypothetical protein
MQLKFNDTAEGSRHTCTAKREGDWAIFSCPLCPGFERRMNLRTGVVKIREGQDPYILHEGYFVPVGLEDSNSLPN